MSKVVSGLADNQNFNNEYQPSTWDTMLKTLFSYFLENGLLYKRSNNFLNARGTYVAYLDHKYTITAKSRTEISSLPNRSAIDLASHPKIDAAIKSNRIMSFTNYINMILLKFQWGSVLCYGVGKSMQILARVTLDYLQLLQEYKYMQLDYKSNPELVIGYYRLAQMASIFEERYGFEKPMPHKLHDKRAFEIVLLSNSSVSEEMKLRASRHSNMKMDTPYQRLTNENIDKKCKAVNPSPRKSSDSEQPVSPSLKTPTKTNLPSSNIVININTKKNQIMTPGMQSNWTPEFVQNPSLINSIAPQVYPNKNKNTSLNIIASNQVFPTNLQKMREEMKEKEWIRLRND